MPINILMKNLLVLAIFLLLSNQVFAHFDEYQQVLEQHAKLGHLPKQDVIDQERKSIEAKAQPNLGKTVRSVASKMIQRPETLKLVNPAIEISTK